MMCSMLCTVFCRCVAAGVCASGPQRGLLRRATKSGGQWVEYGVRSVRPRTS
jgi:hypothetical protein